MDLKTSILKFHARYHYPQWVFSRKITAYLNENNNPQLAKKFLDAPCGAGEVSHQLSKSFAKSTILGCDLSGEAISWARANFGHKDNLTFVEANVFDVLQSKPDFFDVICIVNSLFLLPKIDELMRLLHQSLNANGELILIIPNKDADSFLNFHSKHPSVNTFVVNLGQLENYLEHQNFKVVSKREALKINLNPYAWVNKLSLFKDFFLIAYNWYTERFAKNHVPAYYMVVAKKQ